MSKRLFRSFISLFLVLTVVLSVSGLISEDVYAATLATDIAGLTASYTNGEWTASGSTLSGSATGVAGGGCGSSASSTTSTLTLTNSSGSTAQLSFDYARPALGSGGSVTIDGTAVNAAGSFQKELASGGSINVVIVSGSAGAYTSSITLNNVSVTVKKNVTTTFAMPQGSGTYSYNGNQVVTQVSDTRLSTEGYRLVATPASGYKLEGWYSATKNTFFSTDSSFTAYFDEDQTIYPVFIPSDSPVWEVGTKWFTDLNEAITYSSTANINKITLVADGTLAAGSYTIPSGKTVLIPYDAAKTISTTSPAIIEDLQPSGLGAYRTLTVASGAVINVNGVIDVNAKVNSDNNAHTGATTGKYGYIRMQSGSNITLNSGANLYCWGYISGDGTITAKSGANVYEPFQIADIRGGTATSAMNNNNRKVLPFSQYYIQNIEAPLTINHGASEYAVGSITISGQTATPRVKFIGSSGAMFNTTSGGSFIKRYDPLEDRNYYTVNGSATLNSVTMSAYISINTANYVLPIMENTTITVNSGTTTVNQDLCMIPGSELIIASGATAKVASGKNVYVYDRDEFVGGRYIYPDADMINSYYSPTRQNANKFNVSNMVDTRVDVNGTIDATGNLYTTASGADIVSTEGSGKVLFSSAPNASTTTYQAVQSGSSISYSSISATAPKLHNGSQYAGTSEEYTLTADPSGQQVLTAAGDEYTYNQTLEKWGKWVYHTVTFKDGSTTLATVTVVNGDKVTRPEDPQKEGAIFAGWYNGNTLYDFDTPVTGDITLTAAWSTLEAPVYTWSDDNLSVTATAECLTDPSLTVTETVTATRTVTTEPTCTAAGLATYTAVFTNDLFTTQTRTEELPALGHAPGEPVTENTVAATCESAGSHDVAVYCTRCGVEISRETVTDGAALGHLWGEPTWTWSNGYNNATATFRCQRDTSHVETVEATVTVQTNEATCTAAGGSTYTATAVFNGNTYTAGQVQTTPAIGHRPADAVTENTVAATCEAAGHHDEVVYCSACGEELSRETITDPALGHTWSDPVWTWTEDFSIATVTFTCERDASHVETVNATVTSETTAAACTSDGQTAYTATAEFNGTTYTDGKTKVLPATGHTPAEVVTENAVAATCETAGHHDVVVYCSVCGAELSRETITDPALGHIWGDPVWTWADNFSTASVTFTCERDASHVETVTAVITSETTAATCTDAGQTVYTATAEFNGASYTDNKTEALPATGHTPAEAVTENAIAATCEEAGHHDVVVYCSVCGAELSRETVTDAALGHAWGAPVWTWSDDFSSATATFTCERDATHVETVNAVIASETTAATCTEAGKTIYTATAEFNGSSFTDNKTKVLPATGHTPSAPVTENTVAPTCEAAGHHDVVVYCSVCGAELSRETVTDPALGHIWGDPEWTWAEDYSTATVKFTCERDASHVETANAVITSETTAATCTEDGSTVYTATAEFNGASYTDNKTKVLPATGHTPAEAVTENAVAATCEAAGYHDVVVYCSVCGVELSRETVTDPALGHSWGDPVWAWADDFSTASITFTCERDATHVETVSATVTSETTAATCTEAGQTVYNATAEFNGSSFTDSKTKALPATGHTPAEAVTENTVVPTCETAGHHDVVVYCSVCGAELSRETITDSALGHIWGEPVWTWTKEFSSATATFTCERDASHVETVTAVITSETTAATCTDAGQTVYTATAEFNGESYTDNKTEALPATGHTPAEAVTENAAAATCEAAGHHDVVVYCSVCGAELSRETVTDAALGHAWGAPVWTWSDDFSSATATFTCERDATHVETVSAAIASETTAATCTEAGQTVYTATAEFNGESYTDNKTRALPATGHVSAEAVTENAVAATCEEDGHHDVVVYCSICGAELSRETVTDAALGHAWGEPAWTWAEDYSTAAVTFTCSNDATHVETVTAVIASETTAATCTDAGQTVYTATAEFNGTTYTDGKTKVLPATGHTPAEAVMENAVAATCEEAGHHDVVVYCSVCGTELSRETVTDPALGHEWGDPVWTWAEDFSTATASFVCGNDENHTESVTATIASETEDPTCTADGQTVYIATAVFDGKPHIDSKTKVLPATGHTPAEAVTENAVAATCEEDGHHDVVVYCSVCGAELSRETVTDPALGHIWGDPEWTWAEDYSTATVKFTCERDESHVENVTATVTSATTAATCTEDGSTVYTATAEFSGETYTDSKTKVLPATGHKPAEAMTENVVAPTCEEAGHHDEVVYCTVCGAELSRSTVTDAALGHVWGDPEWTWTEDYSAATVKFTCERDESHVENVTATVTSETTAATCTEAGKTVYSATAEFSSKTYTDSKTKVLPALGHKPGEAVAENVVAPTCEEAGHHDEVVYCSVCGAELSRSIVTDAALGHIWGDPEWTWAEDYSTATVKFTCERDESHVENVTATVTSVTTAATCTEDGKIVYSATAEFNGETYTDSKTKVLPALGHKPAEAMTENVVAPTCEKAGHHDEVVYCTVCGAELSRSTVTDAALGHIWGDPEWTWTEDYSAATVKFTCERDESHVENVTATVTSETTAATCTEAGKTVYSATAEFSGETYTDSKTKVLPALGHKPGEAVAENVVAPTCEEAGHHDEVVYCSVCGAELSRSTVTDAALGHIWGDPEWTWTDDYSAATVKFTCERDESHVENVTATVTSTTTAATCTEDGRTVYSATAEFDGETYTDSKVIAIPAIDHKWGAPIWNWTGHSAATATFTCENDSTHIRTIEAIIVNTTTPAGCESTGEAVYTATVTGPDGKNYSDSVKETIPALGHIWGDPEWIWTEDYSAATVKFTCERDESHVENVTAAVTSATTAATCTEDGKTVYTATAEFNGETYTGSKTKVLPATGHKPAEATTENIVAPTCEVAGHHDEVVYCTVCGAELSRSTVTDAALGHLWGEPEWTWTEDYSAATVRFTCERDESHVEDVTATVTSATTAATCTEDGKTVYTATAEFNGETYTDSKTKVLSATGHVWGDPEWAWAEDYSTATVRFTCERDESHVEDVTATVTSATTAATCTEDGKTVYTATAEFNGETYNDSKTKVLPAAGHTPGETVTENVVGATCTAAGHHDEVIYCTVCGVELSREIVTDGAPLGHDWGAPVWTWAEDHSKATATFSCLRDASHEQFIAETTEIATNETEVKIIYTATVTGPDGNEYSDSATTYKDIPADSEVIRLAGNQRYDTSILCAKELKKQYDADSFDAVVLTTGVNFPDALSGAYLAADRKAPVLLINEASAEKVTAYVRENLAADGTVYILGGEGAVPDEWLASLADYRQERLSGSNRYITNIEILEEVGYDGGTILVCTGVNYADSLSASGADAPILLVGAALTEEQKEYLEGVEGAEFVMVGGTGAVSESVEAELAEYGQVTGRLAGSNRYETSVMIADRFFDMPRCAVAAYAMNFPDGLSGGPLASALGAPIILTQTSASGLAEQYALNKDIRSGYVLGGPALISDETVKAIFRNDTIRLAE